MMGMLGETGIIFFGTMSASISHEIRNSMAVINENAGLIRDLLLMAQKGMSPDMGRIDGLAQKITGQVRKANTILDNMNQFAHSADEPLASVDVVDSMRLIVDLSGRFASMRGVRLEFHGNASPCRITTSPFLLENLMYLCLDHAMGQADDQKTISVNIKGESNTAHIVFSGMKPLEEAQDKGFPSRAATSLLQALEAKLQVEGVNGRMTLSVSEQASV